MKLFFRKNEYRALEKALGYSFRSRKLLETALTHRSFKFESGASMEDNERLEFLGDSVLGMITGAHLFESNPQLSEGALTVLRSSITSGKILAKIARELGLGQYLKLGRGEIISRGNERPSILANTLEALIGAAYLDGGLKAAERIFRKNFQPRLKETGLKDAYEDNPKGIIQQLSQSRWKRNPLYQVVAGKGPAHARIFTVKVSLPDGRNAVGSANSKKEAEIEAAAELLKQL